MKKITSLTGTSKRLVESFERTTRADEFSGAMAPSDAAAAEMQCVAAKEALCRHVRDLETQVRALRAQIREVSKDAAVDRRNWSKAKAAISTPMIKITRPDGRVEAVKNPFYQA